MFMLLKMMMMWMPVISIFVHASIAYLHTYAYPVFWMQKKRRKIVDDPPPLPFFTLNSTFFIHIISAMMVGLWYGSSSEDEMRKNVKWEYEYSSSYSSPEQNINYDRKKENKMRWGWIRRRDEVEGEKKREGKRGGEGVEDWSSCLMAIRFTVDDDYHYNSDDDRLTGDFKFL